MNSAVTDNEFIANGAVAIFGTNKEAAKSRMEKLNLTRQKGEAV